MGTQEQIRFVGGSGAELAGVLHRPDGTARGSVLVAHCFTCSKDLSTTTRMTSALVDAGFAAFRFDFTGLGGSDGEFSATTVSSNVGDLARAAMVLIQQGFGPCGLFGHSLGGAAVLLAASRLKTVRSVAVLAAPSSPDHVRRLLGDTSALIRDGSATVDIGGRPFRVGADFVADLDAHDELAAVASLGRPLLVLHPVDDTVVPVAEGERIFAAAAQPKAFVPLLATDHLLGDRVAARAAGRILADWFGRTLDPAGESGVVSEQPSSGGGRRRSTHDG